MLELVLDRLRRPDTASSAWRPDRGTSGRMGTGIGAAVVGPGRLAAGLARRTAALDGRRRIGSIAAAAIDSTKAAGTADYFPRISR